MTRDQFHHALDAVELIYGAYYRPPNATHPRPRTCPLTAGRIAYDESIANVYRAYFVGLAGDPYDRLLADAFARTPHLIHTYTEHWDTRAAQSLAGDGIEDESSVAGQRLLRNLALTLAIELDLVDRPPAARTFDDARRKPWRLTNGSTITFNNDYPEAPYGTD